jgi:hypothetical protein
MSIIEDPGTPIPVTATLAQSGLNVAATIGPLAEGSVVTIAVDWTNRLRTAETIVSATVVDEDGTLTPGTPTINSVAMEIQGHPDAAVGKVVMFSLSGYTAAASPYRLKVTATTNATPATVDPIILPIRVETI